jgi:fluoride exporter
MAVWAGMIAVAMGAVPGALCRYGITQWSKRKMGDRVPYGTFLINLTGCLLMGILVAAIAKSLPLLVPVRLSVATGFLGAYTTFSTYEYDIFGLCQRGRYGLAGAYGVGSVVLGSVALGLGMQLVDWVR